MAAVLMTACAAPEFKQPRSDAHGVQGIASARRGAAADGTHWKQGVPAERQPRGEWWLAFNDPALKADQRSHPANANLAVAAARVKQARAIAGIAEADRIRKSASWARSACASDLAGPAAGTPVAPATSSTPT
jgi:multidrug efflux system outer membrane protein